jgi:SAM-dependent methyltransferase
MEDNGPAEDASRYWVDRALVRRDPAAVIPDCERWPRYHAWSKTMLQRWTLGRALADRRRYRRCVDFGCGLGDWATLFAPHVDELHACDLAQPFVTETRARLAELGHTAWHVECANVRSYRIPRGVDLAYLGAVLMYVPDITAVELLRRLRVAAAPNALVIVRDYCTFNLGRPRVYAPGYSVHRSPSRLRALGELAGLRCVEVRSSPSIYAEVMGGRVLGWPLRAAWRLATLHWLRASHTLVFRA